MKIRKPLIIFLSLILATMLFGCSFTGAPEEPYEPLFDGIEYFADTAYVLENGSRGPRMEFYDEPCEETNKTVDQFLNDDELQSAVQERTKGLVLDNDAAILAYAWDLQPVLQEFSYIPDDYFPTWAARYSNGVVEIIYLNDWYIDYVTNIHENRQNGREFWDIDIHVFVSETDGHIIHYFSMVG